LVVFIEHKTWKHNFAFISGQNYAKRQRIIALNYDGDRKREVKLISGVMPELKLRNNKGKKKERKKEKGKKEG
jgi:hypothetical protein